MFRLLNRLLAWLGLGRRPPGGPKRDPYAMAPARLKPQPGGRLRSTAVAEPDDE
jgi:hypothetical protein